MDNCNCITELYNIFAKLCQYIVTGREKNYLVRYGCISTNEKKRIKLEIEKNTSLFRGENGRFVRVSMENIDQRFVDEICSFSRKLMDEDDNNSIMGLLQALDGTLSEVLKLEVKKFQKENFSKELNTNRKETGIGLLPRCDCVWARKSRMSYSYRRIDNYLKHFMVMEDRVLYEIKDRHIFLPNNFFKNFDKTKMLYVAASPITAKANFDINRYEDDNFKVFSIKYKKECEEKDNMLVWDKICTAGRAGSEIIIFPEMLGNSSMVEFIGNKLNSLDNKSRKNIPAMIVLPSFSDDGENTSTVFDKFGNILAVQHKHNPYVINTPEGDYMENLNTIHNEINVFHYEGIGRFAILICKDFLTTRYMERIMRGFMLTMIIVPSFSTGTYDFKTSFDLCAHDYCNVVWINSCSAMVPEKAMNFENIGYVRKRISRYDDESEALCKMKPCEGLFEGKCDNSCIYYDSFGKI